MDRIDVMVDLETLGTGACPPVFQLAAKAFNIETGEILNSIELFCDISTSESKPEEQTVMWWLNTNFKLFTQLLAKGVNGAKTEAQMIEEFITWFNSLHENPKKIFLWGNGINFDNRIIAEKCKQYGLTYPVFYRNDMDVRTILEMAALKMGFDGQIAYRKSMEFIGEAHNADDDVLNQIKIVSKAYTDLIH